MMRRRALVTGGAGFIGSHVADALLAAGHEVAVVDNLSTGSRENVAKSVTFYEADITDEAAIRRIWADVGPEDVFHLAAQMDVRVSTHDPLFDAKTNILGSLVVILASVDQHTERIVYASSGGAAYGEPRLLPATEDMLPDPLSPYGVTKHTVEHYLALYRRWGGPSFAALRLPNVYGPRQSPKGEAGVIAIFLGRILKGQEVVVYGDGEQTRDYVFVSDVVDMFARAAHDKSVDGVFNVGAGREVSVNDIIRVLRTVTGSDVSVRYDPPRVGEVSRIALSATRAAEAFGWEPRVSLRDGIQETLGWLKHQR